MFDFGGAQDVLVSLIFKIALFNNDAYKSGYLSMKLKIFFNLINQFIFTIS